MVCSFGIVTYRCRKDGEDRIPRKVTKGKLSGKEEQEKALRTTSDSLVVLLIGSQLRRIKMLGDVF